MPKNNSLEKDIQNRFFDILVKQEKGYENTNIEVYQKLVFTRYEEVIKNSFPLLIENINQKTLIELINKFMKNTPYSPFIWKIPKDFKKFVKRIKAFKNKKYLYELMYYDWIEIELFMKEYKIYNKGNFSYKNRYKLSKSAKFRAFTYDIINKNIQEKRDNFLVIYYDFKADDVVYREINQLIFELFKRVDTKQTIGKILKQLCKENDIDFKEAKNLLAPALNELYINKVFI